MTLSHYFADGNSLILELESLPSSHNNFMENISLKHLQFTIYLKYQLKKLDAFSEIYEKNLQRNTSKNPAVLLVFRLFSLKT
jgi:hypothetical protein